MGQFDLLLSLTTKENDYQLEQAAAAERAAHRLGAKLTICYANNDPIEQSQQILQAVQGEASVRPHGVIFEPIGGTALAQVARAAAAAKMAWVVLNREAEYLSDLRSTHHVPAFCLTSDHEDIGRIQGRQIGVLLPQGGTVLYIQGPAESLAARDRSAGMCETKPPSVQLKLMKAHWTEESAHKVVSSWLRLSTSQECNIALVAAQNDLMAVGAKKAFQELGNCNFRDRALKAPFLGCDGLPKTGQAWVSQKLLAGTVVIPPNAGQAIEMLVHALRTGEMPRERTFTSADSFPSLDALVSAKAQRAFV